MAVTNRDVYFANDTVENAVEFLQEKANRWWSELHHNTYLDKMKRSWSSYFGVYYENNHAISYGGEIGELTNIALNHYRNIAKNILTMTTATRPTFQAKSVNTDAQSRIQTVLANGLLDFYMRDKRLEVKLKTAVEYAIVMSTGYIKMDWNSTTGEIFDHKDPTPQFEDNQIPTRGKDGNFKQNAKGDFISKDGKVLNKLVNEEGELLDQHGQVLTPFPVYEGDVEFKNLSPLDVAFDVTKCDFDSQDWVLIRTFKNKFDIAAKFPEKADEIKKLSSEELFKDRRYVTTHRIDETQDVPVYEFYHKKTETLPDGRYIQYLTDDIVLMDTVMPYRRLPIYRIAMSELLGTPFGYTDMFDLLPIQDALNGLHSTILSNQSAFGVVNILNPQGNDVKLNQVSSGMNFIDYNASIPGGGKPEALALAKTPPEIFNYAGILERSMETISGVNATARGNPESNLTSGNALALIQSQALQFNSGLQQSYIQLIEDIGTGLIQLLQDFAAVPRVAQITGESNRSFVKKFTNKDVDSINRVGVDVGNALSHSTAGRVQMAENMMQMGVITSPEQFISVIETGNLETMTEGPHQELIHIKQENEKLSDGSIDVIPVATDNHSLHIREHKSVLNDPEIRNDVKLVQRALAHINEHIQLLRDTDPGLLQVLNQQPLAPLGGNPVANNGQVPGPTGPSQDQGNQPEQDLTPAQEQAAGNSTTGIPSPAQPPSDPATGLSLNAAERPLG